MFQKISDKDIDLYSAYIKKKEPAKHEKLMKYAILPLVLLVVTMAIFGYHKYQEIQLQDDITVLNQEIATLEAEQGAGNKQVKYQMLIELQNTLENIKTIDSNIESYPEISKFLLDGALNSFYGLADLEELTYEQSASTLRLSVTTANVTLTDQLIRNLKKTELFSDVTYSGYAQEIVSKSTIETLADDETEGAPETEKIYRMDIICFMKKAVAE